MEQPPYRATSCGCCLCVLHFHWCFLLRWYALALEEVRHFHTGGVTFCELSVMLCGALSGWAMQLSSWLTYSDVTHPLPPPHGSLLLITCRLCDCVPSAAAGLAHPWSSFDMGVVLRYAASTLHGGDTEVILLLKRVLYLLSSIDGVSGTPARGRSGGCSAWELQLSYQRPPAVASTAAVATFSRKRTPSSSTACRHWQPSANVPRPVRRSTRHSDSYIICRCCGRPHKGPCVFFAAHKRRLLQLHVAVPGS